MKTKKLLAFLAFSPSLLAMNLQAQAYRLNQVIVLNDGNRLYNDTTGVYTTVGSYNPVTKVYQDFDTIKGAQFGSDVIIDSGYIYVGADSLLIKYDLNTKAKIATQTVVGIREMAIWGNQILVTCGTTFPLSSYFQAYNKNNLQLIYADPNVSNAAQGIKVLNDSAYIAINGFWGTAQNLGVEDLKGQTEKHEVNLDSTGLNPYDVEVEPSRQMVFTVNDLNFTNSTVTQLNAPSTTFNNYSLNLTSSCTGTAYYAGNFYFQPGNENYIGVYSTLYQDVFYTINIGRYVYGMGIDSADGYIYVGVTDYETYGNVFYYDLFGNPIDSFGVDVGPGSFAFDVRSTTGINEVENNSAALNVYPNPSSGIFSGQWVGAQNIAPMQWVARVYNILGEEVNQPFNIQHSTFNIDLSNQPNGIYFLTLQSTNGTVIHKKLIKQQ